MDSKIQDRVRNKDIRKMTKIKDVEAQIRQLKWRKMENNKLEISQRSKKQKKTTNKLK